MVHLDVALTGRVLAFEWMGGGVLFRAARQTVARINTSTLVAPNDGGLPPPQDPSGWLTRRVEGDSRGEGPFRLEIPKSAPPMVEVTDDPGYCLRDPTPDMEPVGGNLVGA